MGDQRWVSSFNDRILSLSHYKYKTEVISDLDIAVERLTHNSYDILILQDGYFNIDSIKLGSMAYAMTRPTLIICNGLYSLIKYKLRKMFSKFFNRYKISKKLICINLNKEDTIYKIIYLVQNHLQYFNEVNEEIAKNTKL